MSNPRNDLRSTHFISVRDVGTEESSLSPLTRKKMNNATFLTETNTIQHEIEIRQKHGELNRYIDTLDEKVQRIVDNNEAELLIAYKNHFARVKDELQEFKRVTLEQVNSSVNQTEKIDVLEKQIIVFRQEAIRLFEQVVCKDKVIEEMKLNLDELMSEKVYMDSSLKELSRRNRLLECELAKQSNLERKAQTENMQKIDLNSFTTVGINSKRYHQSRVRDRSQLNSAKITKAFTQTTRNLNHTTAVGADNTSDQLFNICSQQIVNFSRRLKIKLSYLEEGVLKDVIESAAEIYSHLERQNSKRVRFPQKDRELEAKEKRFSMRSNSNYTSDFRHMLRDRQFESKRKEQLFRKSQQSSKNKESTGFFQKCVETVKKEIARRKNVNSTNFYKEGSPIGVEQFKKIDFFRLLQLVFSNERVTLDLYKSLLDHSK